MIVLAVVSFISNNTEAKVVVNSHGVQKSTTPNSSHPTQTFIQEILQELIASCLNSAASIKGFHCSWVSYSLRILFLNLKCSSIIMSLIRKHPITITCLFFFSPQNELIWSSYSHSNLLLKEMRIVSRKSLLIFVYQLSHLGNEERFRRETLA